MAKAKKTVVKKPGKKQVPTAQRQLKPTAAGPTLSPGKKVIPAAIQTRMQKIAAGDLLQKPATVSITPVQDIHIIEVEVNAETLVTDTDVQKDQAFAATHDVLPLRPLSLFINITGIPNTLVAIELMVDAANEFKGDIYIPDSGRLVLQKIIA